MLLLGLLLVAIAGAAVIGAFFVLDGDAASYFGIDIAPLTVFLIGAATVVLLGLGMKLTRHGAKRELRQRREHRRLTRLAAREGSEQRDGDRET